MLLVDRILARRVDPCHETRVRRPRELFGSPPSTREVVRPTLADARAQGLVAEKRGWLGASNLLDREPSAQRLALALVVRALVQTRSSHDREDELGTGLVQRLVAAAAHTPSRRLEASSWQCVVAVHDPRPRTCGACTFKPGLESCHGCGGTGWIRTGDDERERRSCHGCMGKGWVQCSRCDGGQQISRVTVRTFEDRVGELEHVFLPRVPLSIDEAMSARLLAEDELPEALRVELERASVKLGDYRGNAADSAPHFHGIDASEVLPEAKATIARMATAGTLIERVAEAHAVPLLLCDYEGWTVALAALGERMLAFAGETE